ncbi:hypothetical protein EF888_02070 [Silicimonas algicola]|uniref:Cholesterol transport system auxiliary component n=1 Tax=Silicimonas algicola TaxID=1826607 RepID=A0A316GCP4_9RHOB|nr:DUF6778 family protein [Silicimonas algicola]AZQ66019.1 hypothetical protein EF888_02070 [Silicimonas algicola]PWK58313.1 hypothetical protein C8D95_101119 [Silicimonas algicola]
MKRRSAFLGLALAVLAGCSGNWQVAYDQGIDPLVSRGWRVADVIVVVPDSLKASESNTYAPSGDIVWHGEPFGDRKAQVAALMKEGILGGARELSGDRPVYITAVVRRFHGVTPAAVARAPGAVHNIDFDLQVIDARTRAPLTETQPVSADLEAHVGAAAITAAIEGETQRVRLVRHIAAVTRGWLGLGPDQRRSFAGFGR